MSETHDLSTHPYAHVMLRGPRLIEHAFPLKQTSLDSVHEKNVRHGHISTLHIWPARRPLAACRAALIATLLPDPGSPEKRKELCERIGGKLVKNVERKKMSDGSIVEREKEETEGGILHWGRETSNKADLAWQVRAWGRWVLKHARRELGKFYPTYADFEPLGSNNQQPYERREMQLVPVKVDGTPDICSRNKDFTPEYLDKPGNPRWIAKPTVAYLWARTVMCKNCRATIPLLKTRWLCKTDRKRVLLAMAPNSEKTGVVFAVETKVPVKEGNAAQKREHDKRMGEGTMSRSGDMGERRGDGGTRGEGDGETRGVGQFAASPRHRVTAYSQEETPLGDLDPLTAYYLLHRHDFGMEDAPAGACILYAVSCGLSDRDLASTWDLISFGKGKAGEEDTETGGHGDAEMADEAEDVNE